MPFTSIEDAKNAKFPTTADGITLTLPQINYLAKLYDAIKESGGADNPMVVAWTQWKKAYYKEDETWLTAEFVGAEVPAANYNPKTHIVNALKVGTVAAMDNGSMFLCTPEWMAEHATDWGGGNLTANHYGVGSRVHGNIKRSWFDPPFISMELDKLDPETERRMEAEEHTGFSFEARGNPLDPFGTDLTILFYPHTPACKIAEGCGLVENNVFGSQSYDDKKSRGNAMPEGKTLTEQEIAAMKADVAEVTNLRAEVARLTAEVSTSADTISAKDAEIKELNDAKDSLFSAEDVEVKVTEAKTTMFTAEAVETAQKEAVDAALVIEREKVVRITAELAAVTQMFPEGLDDTFKAEVIGMIQEGKSHEALVKLGTEINYTSFKASAPTVTGGAPGKEDDTPVPVVGSYDPRTKEWS